VGVVTWEEEMGVGEGEGEVPFVVDRRKEKDWVVNDGYGFSPNDPKGVDQEGFDKIEDFGKEASDANA